MLQNLTYIMNPNYPSALTATSQECKYTVNAVRDSKTKEIKFKSIEKVINFGLFSRYLSIAFGLQNI